MITLVPIGKVKDTVLKGLAPPLAEMRWRSLIPRLYTEYHRAYGTTRRTEVNLQLMIG